MNNTASCHELVRLEMLLAKPEYVNGIPVALDTRDGRILPNYRHYDARLFYRGRKGFVLKFKDRYEKDPNKIFHTYATANGFYKIHVNRASDWRFYRDNEILYYH